MIAQSKKPKKIKASVPGAFYGQHHASMSKMPQNAVGEILNAKCKSVHIRFLWEAQQDASLICMKYDVVPCTLRNTYIQPKR